MVKDVMTKEPIRSRSNSLPLCTASQMNTLHTKETHVLSDALTYSTNWLYCKLSSHAGEFSHTVHVQFIQDMINLLGMNAEDLQDTKNGRVTSDISHK